MHTHTMVTRILSQSSIHSAWLVYWVGCIAAVVVIASSAKGKLPKIILRKFFHFAAVAMFVPAWLIGVCVRGCVRGCVCVYVFAYRCAHVSLDVYVEYVCYFICIYVVLSRL